jgi:hypothetical protein
MWIWFYPNVNFIFEISKYSRITPDLEIKDLFVKLENAGVKVSSISIPSDCSGLYVSPQTGTTKQAIAESLSQVQLTINLRDIVIGEPGSIVPLPAAVIISSQPADGDIIDYGIVWTK